MTAYDFYPTPKDTATSLVGTVTTADPRIIADFSAGAGSLLLAAQEKWPAAKIVAVDIQRKLIREVSSNFPDWHVGTCDFLSKKSASSCRVLQKTKGEIDLAILNPPFTSSTSQTGYITPAGESIRCGTAMQFLLRASEYMSPSGEISAIMPVSAIYGTKDQAARDQLSQKWDIAVGTILDRRLFKNCFAETAIINLKLGSPTKALEPTKHESSFSFIKSIKRGTAQVHEIQRSKSQTSLPFIHSSNLIGNRVVDSPYRVNSSLSIVAGPAVLIHRVGRPDSRKVARLSSNKKVVISDCVIAICANTAEKAQGLADLIIRSYPEFSLLYRGTGAPYITLERLRDFFARKGIL